jgi:hypothetical protein
VMLRSCDFELLLNVFIAQIETSLLKQETKEHHELIKTGPETCVSMGSDSEQDMISQDTVRELWVISLLKTRLSTLTHHLGRGYISKRFMNQCP